ncbi:response regulator [candidate division KSB1 bacterium]|nr:response regulator [candidate division KSB1 bacterium]
MRKRILVVDDDKAFADDLVFLLNGSYQFTVATSSKEALAWLEKASFDLVILDLVLPAYLAESDEMEGVALYKKIRAKYQGKALQVIIVTGANISEDKIRAGEAGIDKILRKSSDLAQLRQWINQ